VAEIETHSIDAEKSSKLNGTILTGEIFAPEMRRVIEKTNRLINSSLKVVAVKNEYFWR
jgi:phenylacetate-coenzyme A ligase PaaK-like adenylate-forming protein